VDDFERLLLEYLVALSAPSLVPYLAVVALVVAVAVLAAVVTVVLLHIIGALRFRAAPSVRVTRPESPRPKSSAIRGPVRARAPSLSGEFARA